MKKSLGGACVVLLGAILAVGCGGAMQEETETPPPASSGSAPAAALPDEPAPAPGEPPFGNTSTGEVGEQAVCCFVKCGGVDWAGPYPKVVYNNCPNYAKYSCKQRGLAYESNAWKKC